MDKENIFCSSKFHMDIGDVLHILVKDLVGVSPTIELTGENDAFAYLDFLWTGNIVDDCLISDMDGRKIQIVGRDFVGNFIPGSSSATFRLVNDADFVADDATDNLWFAHLTTSPRNVTVAELIGYDYRTVVKYNNSAPFDITAIGLLNSSVVLNTTVIDYLSSTFELWLFWSGVLNDFGFIKDNRIIV